MTDQSNDARPSGRDDQVLTTAEIGFRTLMRKTIRMMRDFDAGADIDVKEISGQLGAVAKALTDVLGIYGKVEDARRECSGGGGLDLADARAEIGRRLDRLGRAASEGDVS